MPDDFYQRYERTLNRHSGTADRVVRALARALDVSITRCALPPDAAEVHPTVSCAFDKGRRRVYYWTAREDVRIYLPHEIIHVVWPDQHFTGPRDEWDSGMISYETAWLKRLCQTTRAQACYRAWFAYASEGRPNAAGEREALATAKRVVHDANLPSPWGET